MHKPLGKSRLAWWILLAAAIVLAQHIARWGRLLKTSYTLAPPQTWSRPPEPKRWLIVCLDGVPLADMDRLWNEGHFREFARPATVISTFPSDSETALTAALHAPPVPSYEHRYFDRAERRIRGGVWMTLTGEISPYLRLLDYDEPGIFKGLHFVLRRKTYRADIGRFAERFRASRSPVFIAHLASTDALYHMLPPDEVASLLAEFEALIREIYLGERGELGIILFSDHGNTRTPSRAVPLRSTLSQRGWRLRERLGAPRDVAVPAYGLIGFLAVYCANEAVPTLARDLTGMEGTDLAIYRDGEKNAAWVLDTRGGRAYLRWSEDGKHFWYETPSGDPLELGPVFAELGRAGHLAQDGAAADADLFSATITGHYPDAAARIRDWASDHVLNRASIAVSLKPGYYYGSGIFQHLVGLQSTHGALEASSSLGFAMSTSPLPRAARLSDLLPGEILHRRAAHRP